VGEAYKAEIIRDLPEGETITLYRQGDWLDLCRGPHFPSTKHLGKAMDLFHLQEEGRGMIFWHPKGWALYRTLEAYLRRRLDADGYQEVKTPQIMDRSLWERSGHWEKFGASMFVCETAEGEELAVKPMNCPGHIQIFNVGQKSYRDLPLRMSEFGACHRFEPSGALHGIMRLRAFTQDDAHIFCREDQIEEESTKFVRLLETVYRDCGLELHAVKLALRPDLRFGTDEIWDVAEQKLERAAIAAGCQVEMLPGEGAFYGPKLEFHLKDAIGRTWQCGTLQVDLNLPGRLGAHYIDEHSQKQVPVMLHRAIFGSLERFFGILLEHHAGKLPAWLAPTQAVVMNITDKQDAYVTRVVETLRNQGVRAEVDLRNEKVGFKIRAHTLQRVPYLLVAGDKEVAANQVSVRTLSGKDLGTMSPEDFVSRLRVEVESHGRTLLEG
jgi:threonyl-tRNA synthetase